MPNLSCTSDLECGESDACLARRCADGVCASEATSCDDGDVCTADTCDALSGCAHRQLALDSDGDGFKGPRPGFAPGAPNSCGTDCDDRSAAAFPGNAEMCDGVDNDCNGVVDDGTSYVATKMAPIRVSTPKGKDARRHQGGLVAGANGFVLTYTAYLPFPSDPSRVRSHPFMKGLRSDGSALFESDVSDVNAESFAGSLSWSGNVLATAWDDARVGGNYEIYLGRFTANGEKLAADQRVTDALGFSKSPYITWNQSEFVLAWDDSRKEARATGNRVAIFGQRAAADGTLLGTSVPLVDDGQVNEAPMIALGPERLALVYAISPADGLGTARFGFRTLDAALATLGAPPEPMGIDVQSPTVHFVGDRFVVLWELYSNSTGPGNAIWGAAFDQQGRLLLPPRQLTSGGAHFARTHDALSLGDRLILMWGEDLDGNYEIFWQVLGLDLNVREPRQRLTFNAGESKSPGLAAGPGGKIGVVFEDSFEGSRQVYFTTLECGATSK